MLAAETWDFGTDPRWDLFARLDRALALLESGRADEAAAVYRRCGTPARWVVPRAARLVVLAVGIQVTAGLGVLDDLAVLRESLVPYRGRYVAAGWGAVHFLGPVDLFLGTAASALSEPEAAQELLAAAAVQCRDIGAPGLLVECACVRAEAAYRSGDRPAAARIAAETLPLAGALGMGPWVDRLRAMTTAASTDGLSPREREVAALVAEGSATAPSRRGSSSPSAPPRTTSSTS
jgi:hypothetical protein